MLCPHLISLLLRLVLAVNSQLQLIADDSGESVFVKASEEATLLSGRELFSFGSGQWFDGSDAVEVMETDSKWISCSLTMDSLIVLERKKVLAHLSQLSCLEKPVPLREVLRLLEDAGEAQLASYLLIVDNIYKSRLSVFNNYKILEQRTRCNNVQGVSHIHCQIVFGLSISFFPLHVLIYIANRLTKN